MAIIVIYTWLQGHPLEQGHNPEENGLSLSRHLSVLIAPREKVDGVCEIHVEVFDWLHLYRLYSLKYGSVDK